MTATTRTHGLGFLSRGSALPSQLFAGLRSGAMMLAGIIGGMGAGVLGTTRVLIGMRSGIVVLACLRSVLVLWTRTITLSRIRGRSHFRTASITGARLRRFFRARAVAAARGRLVCRNRTRTVARTCLRLMRSLVLLTWGHCRSCMQAQMLLISKPLTQGQRIAQAIFHQTQTQVNHLLSTGELSLGWRGSLFTRPD